MTHILCELTQLNSRKINETVNNVHYGKNIHSVNADTRSYCKVDIP